MQQTIDLYNRLNQNKEFGIRYPNFNMYDGKKHVLFLPPLLDESGFYRAILPYFELNQTSTHSAIIAGLNKKDFTKSFDDYDIPLERPLVQWAHYVVMPAILTDIEYIINAFKSINPDLKFVMDIDTNYWLTPDYLPKSSRPDDEKLLILLNNMSKMDIIVSPNDVLLDYIDSKLEENYPECEVFLTYSPNLLSGFTYQNNGPIEPNKSGKINIGLVGNVSWLENFSSLNEALATISNKYGRKVDIVVFGWNSKDKSQFRLPFEFEYRSTSAVRLFEYHQRLTELKLDIALIPLSDSKYNASSHSFIKYLEHSINATSVVASDMYPFNQIITNNVNGFLAKSTEEWVAYISALIESEDLRKKVGRSGFKNSYSNFSYNSDHINRLCEIFI